MLRFDGSHNRYEMKIMLIQALKKLQSYGFQPRNILDIGANKGNWSLEVNKKVFRNCQFTLVEPIEYEELEKLGRKFNNFTILNALLDETERKVIWYEERNTGDSIFKENTGHFKKTMGIEKSTSSLDKIFSENNIFDLIKIDCQGAELPILKGGKKLIQESEVIILELPFMGQYNIGVPDFFEHIKYMNDIGYKVFDIIEMHRVQGILIQVDIIFIKKENIFEQHVNQMIQSLGE